MPRPGGELGIFLVFRLFSLSKDHSATAPPFCCSPFQVEKETITLGLGMFAWALQTVKKFSLLFAQSGQGFHMKVLCQVNSLVDLRDKPNHLGGDWTSARMDMKGFKPGPSFFPNLQMPSNQSPSWPTTNPGPSFRPSSQQPSNLWPSLVTILPQPFKWPWRQRPKRFFEKNLRFFNNEN